MRNETELRSSRQPSHVGELKESPEQALIRQLLHYAHAMQSPRSYGRSCQQMLPNTDLYENRKEQPTSVDAVQFVGLFVSACACPCQRLCVCVGACAWVFVRVCVPAISATATMFPLSHSSNGSYALAAAIFQRYNASCR